MNKLWNRERLKNVLTICQIGSITVIILGAFAYLWLNTDIKNVDPILQIVSIGAVACMLIFAINHILNRRW